MKTKKFVRIASVMLVLIFTMSAVVSANAATFFEESGFKYLPTSDFNCRIYGYTGTDKNVSVPNKLSSFTVLEIADSAFMNNKDIESVSFANAKAIDAIGEFSFAGCTSLKSVNIPSTLDKIGYAAFMGCTSLTSVNISSNISEIKGQTFQNCTSLTEFTVPNSVGTISDFSFAGCTSLEKVVIPKTVKNISDKAFLNCDKLTIFGYTNSYAETYAEENGINFVALDKKTLYGDVNLDGKIDVNDVTLLQRYIAGESVLTDDAVKAADFNKDRIIDVIDATAIQTFIAHGQN
ncbi:leucine-rich repeat protein [Ruminococcus sp. FMB-CY1]|uniref:leucine-rich repeat protein n=1 Tax=unclassified Ruminococcus TaxID=2608920 RepID=UPI00208E54BA|nr:MULTISPECIES: leucine-rich repeat protein [unclassified Ruminococcus]USP70107.1 leucine-rich repeat protein [Ruminococcus sp. FMBCY1]WBX56577.1 leucine-rich repeat protein [Ruminococcus sp. FMB-CY1]